MLFYFMILRGAQGMWNYEFVSSIPEECWEQAIYEHTNP